MDFCCSCCFSPLFSLFVVVVVVAVVVVGAAGAVEDAVTSAAEDVAISLRLITFFTAPPLFGALFDAGGGVGEEGADLARRLALMAAATTAGVGFLLGPTAAVGVATFIATFFACFAFCLRSCTAALAFTSPLARDLAAAGLGDGAGDDAVDGDCVGPEAAAPPPADLPANVELLATVSMAEDDCPFLFVRISGLEPVCGGGRTDEM